MSHRDGFSKTKKFIMGIIDVVIYHIAIVLSFYIRYEGTLPIFNYTAYERLQVYIFVCFVLLNIIFGVYILYNKTRVDQFFLTIIIQVIMTFIIMAMTYASRWFSFPRTVLAISFVVSTLLLFLWRVISFNLYEKFDGSKSVMVVGDEESCKNAIKNFDSSKSKRHRITTALISNFYENVKEYMDTVDIIYLTKIPNEKEKVKIYDLLIKNDKKLFLNTSFENLVLVNPNIMSIEDESLIEVSNFRISPEEQVIKRTVDIVCSGLLLLITLPIILITAILVKVTSKGPVFYKQVRITKNQKEFNIYKFRTMSVTAESASGPVLASSNDSRVTGIGKYLRSFRIDELPQLFNVLKGDMSMVGPRPERPFFVNQFEEQNKYYYLRHNVRAGITGYAQVYGKYASDFNSKLNFDLVYIKKYSLLLDVKILLQTIKILFDKVSSQGVEEESAPYKDIPEHIKVIK